MSRKSESWDMATALYSENRISLEMSRYALRSSRHNEEEIALFPQSLNRQKKPHGGGKGRRKKVRCVETGEVYQSVLEAAVSAGFSGGGTNISKAIKTGATSRGCHWEFVEKN